MKCGSSSLVARVCITLCVLTAASWNIRSATAATAAETSPSTGWPQWRGPDRDGVSEEPGWSAQWDTGEPEVLWRVKVGIGFSSCSVYKGRVYTMGNFNDTDIVWCISADTGDVLWTYVYPCKKGKHPGPRMTPTVDGEVLYAMSRDGRTFCLKTEDGSVVWKKDLKKTFGVSQTRYGWGFACSPLVTDSRLIFDLGKVVVLNKKTGDKIWVSGNHKAGFSSPVTFKAHGKTYITSFNAYGFALFEAAGGKEFDSFRWKTKYKINSVTPIVSGDKVFISSGYGKGCALLQVTEKGLKLLYSNKEMKNHVNNCVLYEGHLYGFDGQQGSSKGELTCMEFETGEVKWKKPRLKVGSLMIADGKIIAMIDGGELLICEATPEAFKPLGRAEVLHGQCWTYPVLSGGRIFCRSNKEGELACVDVSKQ